MVEVEAAATESDAVTLIETLERHGLRWRKG
jgi:hypothetical protein